MKNTMQEGSAVVSVAYFTNNEELKQSILNSDALRNQTLKACYSIKEYAALPLEQKNLIYDAIKARK